MFTIYVLVLACALFHFIIYTFWTVHRDDVERASQEDEYEALLSSSKLYTYRKNITLYAKTTSFRRKRWTRITLVHVKWSFYNSKHAHVLIF